MVSINQLLDDVKARHAIPSDYKLAMFLNVVPGAVKHWRHERSMPDTRTLGRIADLLGIDGDLLILEVEAQRAGNEESRALWSRIAHRLQGGYAHAAPLLLVAFIGLSAVPREASATTYPIAETPGAVCVMSNNKCRTNP